jgi:cytochrome P450
MPSPKPRPAPGPRPLPVLGHLLHFRRGGLLLTHLHDWRTYGDIVRYQFGPQPGLALVNPEHIRDVTIKRRANYIKGLGLEALRWLVGQGLFTSDGALWSSQRRMMQPHFTAAATRNYAAAMHAAIAEVIARLEQVPAGTIVDLQFEMMRFTMDVICRTMFSMSVADGATRLSEAISETLRWVGKRGLQLVRIPPKVPTPTNRRFTRALASLDEFLLGLIDARTRSGEFGQRGDLLDLLLQATDPESGRGMSHQQLRDELVTIFLAGHETTAVALCWAWTLLAQHRFARDELEAELARVLSGRTPAVGDLPALGYTRRLLDETLRLYPPVWTSPRSALAADEIGGVAVEPRDAILLMIYATHRHPDFWPDPERFDPERFTPAAARGHHPCAYLPFGTGQRTCLGLNFALQEMILLVASVAQRFHLELAPGQQLDVDPHAGTLRARDPLHVRVLPRTR